MIVEIDEKVKNGTIPYFLGTGNKDWSFGIDNYSDNKDIVALKGFCYGVCYLFVLESGGFGIFTDKVMFKYVGGWGDVMELSCIDKRVVMQPLKRKRLPRFCKSISLMDAATLSNTRTKVEYDKRLNNAFWGAFIKKQYILLDLEKSCNLREICNVYGWDLRIVGIEDGKLKCRVFFKRKIFDKVKSILYIGSKKVRNVSDREKSFAVQGFYTRQKK